MAHRCPSYNFEGIGVLSGHRFLINERGVATVMQDEANHVIGVVWTISNADKTTLDRYEGVASDHYLSNLMTVAVDGIDSEVLLYVATCTIPGMPRHGYIEKIIQAARLHCLDPEYLNYLAGFR